MNPITQFLVDHLAAVFFVYGLVFFTLGIALALASRQPSEFRFVRAIRPLAAFGLLHAAHEWLEMAHLIRQQAGGAPPSPVEEYLRLALLAVSFVMLLAFASSLLAERAQRRWVPWTIVIGPFVLWVAASWVAAEWMADGLLEALAMADVLARYLLGIPAALLGSWALMVQQRTFRQVGMPQFGQDLVWCASALLLYGAVGQIFVRESALPPSNVLNSALFLDWFGVPVQIFRAVMAGVLTVFMLRALQAFEYEHARRLEAAVRTQLAAQDRALAVERQSLRESERLNQELETRARELTLLLDLSNLVTAPVDPASPLADALDHVVASLPFADAGMVLLATRGGKPEVAAVTGFAAQGSGALSERYRPCWELGARCVELGKALCRHEDHTVIQFDLDAVLVGRDCWQYISPTVAIALPLAVGAERRGAIVLARPEGSGGKLALDDLRLLAGIAQQMGLSIERTRLYREAQMRERMLGNLLYQVVGAQEAERQRIARDLHDATGQSMTAIALGLRGLENAMAEQGRPVPHQLMTIQSFANDALAELRRIIADLRPPQLDDLGLVAAIRWYLQAFQQRHPDIAVQFEVRGEPPRLNVEVETLLYRIVQEALTNIAKHADATQVEVEISAEYEYLTVNVADNGVGFDVERVLDGESGGWGLVGIRERTQLLGGESRIQSRPGQGTFVSVTMPLARVALPAAPVEAPETSDHE